MVAATQMGKPGRNIRPEKDGCELFLVLTLDPNLVGLSQGLPDPCAGGLVGLRGWMLYLFSDMWISHHSYHHHLENCPAVARVAPIRHLRYRAYLIASSHLHLYRT